MSQSAITSKDRVLKALSHKEPDKIPIDFAASRVTGIHASLYYDLVSKLGITRPEPKIYDVPQMLALPEKPVLEYFQTDVIQLPKLIPAPAIGLSIEKFIPGVLPDGRHAFYPYKYSPEKTEDGGLVLYNNEGKPFFSMSEGGYYFSRTFHPLEEIESKKDIDAFDLHEMVPGETAWLRDYSKKLRNTTYAVLGQFGGNFLERGNRLFGMENFLIRMITEKPLVTYFFEKVLEAAMKDFDDYLEAVGDRVDIIQLNDDLGAQDGPLISEEMYVEMIKPFHSRLVQYIRSKSDMVVFLHSCGSIYPFIPHLIEAGVQIINPLQYSARNMDAEKLKKEFGKDLVFWGGGCDAQKTLMTGSVEDVKKETARQIDILAPGGGFIFSHVHNLQPGTPVENILAMYRVISEKRSY